MEETLVTSFLDRLNYLLIQESEIVYGLEDQILLLKTKLLDLKSQIQIFTEKLIEIGYFLSEEEDATTTTNISTELKKSIQNWLGRFRDTIYDADDCTDQFIIRMNSEDREVAGVVFQSELRMINECLVEILHGKSQLDQSIASIEHRGEVNMQQSSSFALKFNSLPFYLKSCLMYCHILFQQDNWIWKERLIWLLMAEGLIQEIPGERMEDTAEENINKLIELGMLPVQDEELFVWANPIPYLNFVAGDETMFITNTNSETAIPLNIRRLLIKTNSETGNTFELNLNNIRIRSIIISDRSRPWCPLNFLETMFHRLKLLRVLELKLAKLKSLPEEVGNLIHLRYLGLRYCDHLKELPDSLYSLANLQTLDIRHSKINVLPSRIMNLQQLRHLLMETAFHSVLIPTGLGRLTNLQTLTDLYAGGSIASELSNLTQIRKLGVCYLSELEDEIELYASIMKMTGLLSLTLSAEDSCTCIGSSNNKRLLPSFEHFSPPPCLRNLRLYGCLQEMPDWLSSMENLTELELIDSDLPEIPTSILQFLPNLKRLRLNHAFTAKHMGGEFFRSGGFPSLEVLFITSGSLIEWIEVEEGALPSLKHLVFDNCPRLRTLPEGLQLITTLKKLHVFHVHGDLARKSSPNGGRENYKIKHIPETIMCDPITISN